MGIACSIYEFVPRLAGADMSERRLEFPNDDNKQDRLPKSTILLDQPDAGALSETEGARDYIMPANLAGRGGVDWEARAFADGKHESKKTPNCESLFHSHNCKRNHVSLTRAIVRKEP